MNIIERLYMSVTAAIIRAERCVRDGDAVAARSAYLDVSMIEEEIASILPPGDVEAAIARRGAVSAAMFAEIYFRARELIDRYSSEDWRRDDLRDLRESLREFDENARIDDGDVIVDPLATFEIEV